MLRFSVGRKNRETVKGGPTPLNIEEDTTLETSSTKDNNTTRLNYASRTWLASLRKRTLSVESLTNMFSGVGRSESTHRNSLSSANGSMTGGSSTKLARTHKMQTKAGDPVEIFFGYDAVSINGRSIIYADVFSWTHSASHFTMTYLSKSSGRRKDVVLFPTEKGPKPSDLTEMLAVRIARLVADQTGCTEEKAMRMATAKANDTELKEAVKALELQLPNNNNGSGIIQPVDRKAGSAMVEVSTNQQHDKKHSNTKEEEQEEETAMSPEVGVDQAIHESDEAGIILQDD